MVEGKKSGVQLGTLPPSYQAAAAKNEAAAAVTVRKQEAMAEAVSASTRAAAAEKANEDRLRQNLPPLSNPSHPFHNVWWSWDPGKLKQSLVLNCTSCKMLKFQAAANIEMLKELKLKS